MEERWQRRATFILTIVLFSGCAGMEGNRRIVEQLHQARPYSRALLASPALAADVEWWAAGARERLPWAGTWRGKSGVEEFFRVLNAEMDYERFEAEELIADGNRVIAIVSAAGHAIRTGRPFASHIVRDYTFRDGKIVRVRNFYDTAAYERALAGDLTDAHNVTRSH